PVGALAATLGPSLVAGSALDSGTARVRFADRRLYLDSLRIAQPGLVTTGAGSLGLAAGASGRLALDFDADSLVVLDSLAAWLAGGPAGLAGSARAALGLDARVSAERLAWRGWEIPAGRAHVVWRAGPRGESGGSPSFALDLALDSVARGVLAFGGAVARAAGRPDSLGWFARSRVGEGSAFLAGGRFVRTSDSTGGTVLTLGVDSLAVQLPRDV